MPADPAWDITELFDTLAAAFPPPPPAPTWTVDLFAHGLAGRRCHLRPCPQPYAGPYGSRETATREATQHRHQHHPEDPRG